VQENFSGQGFLQHSKFQIKLQSSVYKAWHTLAGEWYMVISQQRSMDEEYVKVAEKIKEELIITLQRKGIKASRIHIDLHSGNVSISISISKES
jgi:hypothetical protein